MGRGVVPALLQDTVGREVVPALLQDTVGREVVPALLKEAGLSRTEKTEGSETDTEAKRRGATIFQSLRGQILSFFLNVYVLCFWRLRD